MNKLTEINPERLKGGFAIQDKTVTNHLSNYLQNVSWSDHLKNDGRLDKLQSEYKNTFRNWIKSSIHNTFNDIDSFQHLTITQGTSEAFHMFMMRNNYRNFKFIAGDFIMHKISSNNMKLDWAWIEIEELTSICHGDALIISCPFSNYPTPSKIPYEGLLKHCDQLNVPVLLDFAYFGACRDINIDLSHKCIEDITFSLGKTFPIIGARAGIRMQRDEIDDPVLFANQSGIVNNFGCLVGLEAMKKFSPDYIFDKYQPAAKRIAKKLQAEETSTVMFQTSTHEHYASLRRTSSKMARLCISNLLVEEYENE